MINGIVSPDKSTFVKGKILYVPTIMNEIIDYYNRKRKKNVILNICLNKSYDSVSLEYMLQIMTFMRFDQRWIWRTKACLVSCCSSILESGAPIQEFSL